MGWFPACRQYVDQETDTFCIQANKRDNRSKAREYLANKLLEATSVGTAKLTPCTVFVDGEYWGSVYHAPAL